MSLDPRRGFVRASTQRALLSYCQAHGVNGRELLERSGAQPELMEASDGFLSFDQTRALWRHAYQLTGDPHLALHVGAWASGGPRSVYYFLFVNSTTVGAAFRRIASDACGITNTIAVEIQEEPTEVALCVQGRGGFPTPRPQLEWMFSLFYSRVRAATGVPFHPERVEFAVPAPEDVREHERVFGCRVLFDQPKNRVWIGRKDWDLPTRNPSPELLQILEAHAALLASQAPSLDSICEVVQRIVSSPSGSVPSIEQVAAELSMSARTLQRRLADEGETFSRLVDAARSAVAQKLLREQATSLVEVAHLTGFSEQSAFTRAFKKWTGMTPAQFRRATAPYSTR